MSETMPERFHPYKELSSMRYRDAITESASDNGLETYRLSLGFKPQDLEGKTIVDMGVGQTNRFQRELAEAGVEATVIGVSYDLAKDSHREWLDKHSPESRGKNVAAIAEILPFGDDTIDEILALYSITHYSIDQEHVGPWMSEFSRVLKKGGQARLAPAYGEGDEYEQEMLQKYAEAAGLVFRLVIPAESPIDSYYLLQKP
jgi:ubiquinone/menaquinone biosynthesis C-methylase UbiE